MKHGTFEGAKTEGSQAGTVPAGVQQVEIAALHGFIDKAERGEPLTAEEAQALRATVSTTAYLTAEIKRKRVSLQRLRNWLFGAPTEKTDRVCPPPEAEADAKYPRSRVRVPGAESPSPSGRAMAGTRPPATGARNG